ncbi:hypothetical protein GN956_G11920 [Arapaima gigas]
MKKACVYLDLEALSAGGTRLLIPTDMAASDQLKRERIHFKAKSSQPAVLQGVLWCHRGPWRLFNRD